MLLDQERQEPGLLSEALVAHWREQYDRMILEGPPTQPPEPDYEPDYESELDRAVREQGRRRVVELLYWAEAESGRLLSTRERARFLRGMREDLKREADRQEPYDYRGLRGLTEMLRDEARAAALAEDEAILKSLAAASLVAVPGSSEVAGLASRWTQPEAPAPARNMNLVRAEEQDLLLEKMAEAEAEEDRELCRQGLARLRGTLETLQRRYRDPSLLEVWGDNA